MNLCYGCMNLKNDNEKCDICGYTFNKITYKSNYLKPGVRLYSGRYELGRVLGSGGFGTTYIAYDHVVGERVAIKEYLPKNISERTPGTYNVNVFSQNENNNYLMGMKRFREEAEMLKNLNHLDGIVNVKNYFEENNTMYIVMEFVAGYTLNSYIRKNSMNNTLSVRETLALFLPLMDVLHKVHLKNVFHRDISPDNLIVNKNNYKIKLIDFGSAKQFVGGQSSQTVTISYKDGYTPPEQYLKSEQGAWSDVFSVAASMYKTITNKKPPFSIKSFNTEWDGNKPSDLGIDIEKHVENALIKALEVDKNKRFQTIKEFKASLVGEEFYVDETLNNSLNDINRVDLNKEPSFTIEKDFFNEPNLNNSMNNKNILSDQTVSVIESGDNISNQFNLNQEQDQIKTEITNTREPMQNQQNHTNIDQKNQNFSQVETTVEKYNTEDHFNNIQNQRKFYDGQRKKMVFTNKIKISIVVVGCIFLGMIIFGSIAVKNRLDAKNKIEDIDKKIDNGNYNEAYNEFTNFKKENDISSYDEKADEKLKSLEAMAKKEFYTNIASTLPEDYSGDFKKMENLCKKYNLNYGFSTDNVEKVNNALDFIKEIETNNKEIEEYEDNKDYYDENKKVLDSMNYYMEDVLEVVPDGNKIITIINKGNGITEADAQETYNAAIRINSFITSKKDAILEMVDSIERDKKSIIESGYFTKKEYDEFNTFIVQGLYLSLYAYQCVLQAEKNNTDGLAENYDLAKSSQSSYNSVSNIVPEFMEEKKEIIENVESKVKEKENENEKNYDELSDLFVE